MKKIISCLCLLWGVANSMMAQKPAWLTKLEKCDIIDSVMAVQDSCAADSNMSVYHLYYHQPLCHAEPGGEQFQMRCVLVIRNDNDPATCANVFYIGGYYIDESWNSVFADFSRLSRFELTARYHANHVIPEHRYFSGSSPDSCWQRLDYLNASEAADDFHQLIGALKTVFLGKWAITGVSKGGVTTAIQHAYYPDDADVYVSKSGPFLRTVADRRPFQYYVSNGWADSTRQRFNAFTRQLLEDTVATSIYARNYKMLNPTVSDLVARKMYYAGALNLGFNTHAYTSRDLIDSLMDNNVRLRQYILQHFGDDVSDSYLTYLQVGRRELDGGLVWKRYLTDYAPKETDSEIRDDLGLLLPISVPQNAWSSSLTSAYNYQASRQLGQIDFDIHYLYPEPEMQHFADSLQAVYDQAGVLFYNICPFLLPEWYDNYALLSWVEQQTQNATKPILFIYGEDDSWTGATMSDQFINGTNVRKYIIEAQCHGVAIEKAPEATRNEIWAYLDNHMGSPTGIDEVDVAANLASHRTRKTMIGGRLAIEKNGQRYNTLGIKMP